MENESRETKYIVDTESMRLLGLRNDHAEDVHRADANRLGKIKQEETTNIDNLYQTLTILSGPRYNETTKSTQVEEANELRKT